MPRALAFSACLLLYAGVNIVRVPKKTWPMGPILMFSGKANNVQHLVLTANVRGLEPLLPSYAELEPKLAAPDEKHDWAVQQRLFRIEAPINLTMVDNYIQGLAPIVSTGDWPNNQNRMRFWNCTFSNTHLAVVGQSRDMPDLAQHIIDDHGGGCMLALANPILVELLDTTFHNITTSVPPGSKMRLRMMCTSPGNNNTTVTLQDTRFLHIRDMSGYNLDLIETHMAYTGRLATKLFTMQRVRFENITAALLAALEVQEVVFNQSHVDGVALTYGGITVMIQDWRQKAGFHNSTFQHVQLGPASEATGLNQEYFNPGVGLLKMGTRAQADVRGCKFRNISLLPTHHNVPLVNASAQSADSVAFIRTAVIAAGADARLAQCTFEDCFTPAVVYAYSGEKETLGQVYSMGTANRSPRDPRVSLVLHQSDFRRNLHAVYADGFQVIVSECNFTDSAVAGMRISGVPCLVLNQTMLHNASLAIQRASNPGGVAFSFCRTGFFPLWLDAYVGSGPSSSQVPAAAAVAAAAYHITGELSDRFDAPVSVSLESVNISGVHGQAALSLSDVHKASLQRVNIQGSVGRGAISASSVAGMLMLRCRIANNSAQVEEDAPDIAGGATFTAVHNLYLLETTLLGNAGPAAGAMLLQSCGPVVINSCSFKDNSAKQNGGAVRAISTASITVEKSILEQPANIDCMQKYLEDVMYDEDFKLDLSQFDTGSVACVNARLGGQPTYFTSNTAGRSGGAVAIEGLTMAAWNATHVNFWYNRYVLCCALHCLIHRPMHLASCRLPPVGQETVMSQSLELTLATQSAMLVCRSKRYIAELLSSSLLFVTGSKLASKQLPKMD